jgi:hypothetical protein
VSGEADWTDVAGHFWDRVAKLGARFAERGSAEPFDGAMSEAVGRCRVCAAEGHVRYEPRDEDDRARDGAQPVCALCWAFARDMWALAQQVLRHDEALIAAIDAVGKLAAEVEELKRRRA